MRERLMEFLLCPRCRGELELHRLASSSRSPNEVETGFLCCAESHAYPIVGGIPRMLPDSIVEYASNLREYTDRLKRVLSDEELARISDSGRQESYDRRTKRNFSLEWESFEPADGTWTMKVGDQVAAFFSHPLRAVDAVDIIRDGALFFDAGCGPGLPSLGYAELGFEVLALDLSTGLEHGEALRRNQPQHIAERVHFVQGDLFDPPFRFGIADTVSSLGVISSTPNTKVGFDSIARVVKQDGVLSVWVYAREPGVTEVVNALRHVTTRIPSPLFAGLAAAAAPVFQAFCWFTTKTGVRSYGRLTRGAARIALMDIFGAPFVHAHTFDEVDGWFREQGFTRTAKVAVGRRGFGAIGVRGSLPANGALRQEQLSPSPQFARSEAGAGNAG